MRWFAIALLVTMPAHADSLYPGMTKKQKVDILMILKIHGDKCGPHSGAVRAFQTVIASELTKDDISQQKFNEYVDGYNSNQGAWCTEINRVVDELDTKLKEKK